MKAKKVFLIVNTCSECPYCEYNPDYNMVKDAGYDCKKAGKRIINDWEWNNLNNPNRLNKKFDGIPIPEWCPLPDKGERDE